MIKELNISNYIQPYLPRYLITDYYQEYFEISLIDIVYYYFNNPDLYNVNSINYKNVKDILTQYNYSEFSCDTCDDIYEYHEINKEDLCEINCMMQNYIGELKRIENIYNVYKNKYSYDEKKDYKNAHLSYELGKRDNFRSCCNIKEFMKNKLCKKYIEDKIQNKMNNKKVKEKHKSIIFILEIIYKLFHNYIDCLKYGINILQNRPYMVNYSEEYMPKIYQDNFIIDKNDVIFIKHLGFINNIIITNNMNKDVLNNGYIKLIKPNKSNRIVIWFE